jgi:STE24 endopeptidase
VADRYSLELTGDRGAFVRAHVDLARSNIADLDPPRLAYLTLFTHPTPPERLALASEPEELSEAPGDDPGCRTLPGS